MKNLSYDEVVFLRFLYYFIIKNLFTQRKIISIKKLNKKGTKCFEYQKYNLNVFVACIDFKMLKLSFFV